MPNSGNKQSIDLLAKSFAIGETVASQLPGRKNGPADAYRHIIWAAELTRRSLDFAVEFALTKKESIDAILKPEGKESPQDVRNAAKMDLHNNQIGFAIGKMVQEIGGSRKDIIVAARKVMEQGIGKKPGDTVLLPSGARVNIPTWLPKEKWSRNPKVKLAPGKNKGATERELTNKEANWPGPGWEKNFVYESGNYSSDPSNKSNHLETPSSNYGVNPAPLDDPIGGSDASADARSGDAAEKSASNKPTREHSPEAKKLLAGLRAAKDTPEEILTKPAYQVTENEVSEVIGSPPYWQSDVPLHKESQGW